jgi:hypothetical protein
MLNSDEKYHFDRLRSEISYEANLIVQRTSWFVTAQAFFFGSLATGLDRTTGVPFALVHSVYFPLIPILALAVSALILLSVWAAIVSANDTRKSLEVFLGDNPEFKDFVKRKSGWVISTGLASTALIPVLFVAAWLYVLSPWLW